MGEAETLIETVEFHTLVAKALPAEPIVLDLGANRGEFSRKMHARYGARCIAVEADPSLFTELSNNGFEAYHFAVSDRSGTVSFSTSENSLAGSIVVAKDGRAVDVPSIDLMALVDKLSLPSFDLLKMDIEGAEIDVFEACSDDFLRSIPQITVEFHDFCGISTSREVERCLKRFHNLGFRSIRMSRVGHQDTLLVNSTFVPLNRLEFAFAKYVIRNFKGAERVLRKLIFGKRWAESY